MNKKQGRRRREQRNEKQKSELEMVTADFVACGRCSFFLAGYRALHGLEALQQAVEESEDAWLTLRWSHSTKQLVQDSYGGRLDIEFYYYDGRCPECQRRYVIGRQEELLDAEDEDDERAGAGERVWETPEPELLRVALTTD